MDVGVDGPPPPSPVPDANYSTTFIGPISVLYAFALLLSAARIYFRIQPKFRMAWDDYTLILVLVSGSIWFFATASMYRNGRGVENYPFDLVRFGPLTVAADLMWLWSLNLMRISMGFMLLRLKDERHWLWPLRVLITLQVSMIIVVTGVEMSICQPISALWNPTVEARCILPDGMLAYVIVYDSFNAISDLIISIMPLTFIGKMNRTFAEKVLVIGLMTACLGATATACVRVITVLRFYEQYSTALLNTRGDLFKGLEMLFSIIGASLPCLKGPAHNFLIRVGFCHPATSAQASSESFLDGFANGSHIRQQMFHLENSTRKDEEQLRSVTKIAMSETGGSRTE